MNKLAIVLIPFLILTLVVGAGGCSEGEEAVPTPSPGQTPASGQITKPTVGYVPQNWYINEDTPYPEIVDIIYPVDWGLIDYTDEVDSDFVLIYYGDVPSPLRGKEDDRDALIKVATDWASTFHTIDETGTMTVAGQLAGYVKGYDSSMDTYELEIVFVKGETCVDIYAVYDATSSDEEEAMSLINSISLE